MSNEHYMLVFFDDINCSRFGKAELNAITYLSKKEGVFWAEVANAFEATIDVMTSNLNLNTGQV